MAHHASVRITGEKLRLFLTVSREFRQQQQLKNSEAIMRLLMPGEIFGRNESLYAIIRKQLNVAKIELTENSITADPAIRLIPFQSYQLGFESPQKLYDSKRKEEL